MTRIPAALLTILLLLSPTAIRAQSQDEPGLKDQAAELADQAGELADQAGEKAGELAKEGLDAVKDLWGSFRETIAPEDAPGIPKPSPRAPRGSFDADTPAADIADQSVVETDPLSEPVPAPEPEPAPAQEPAPVPEPEPAPAPEPETAPAPEPSTTTQSSTGAIPTYSPEPEVEDRAFYLEDEQEFSYFAGLISQVGDEAAEALDLRQQYDDAPESRLIWGETKASIQEELDDVLNKIERMVFDGEISDAINRSESIDRERKSTKSDIARMTEKRYSAPEESLFSDSKKSLTADIEEAETRLRELDREEEQIRIRIAERFNHIGVQINDDQIDVLLSRIDGNDIIGMTVMIQTVAKMTDALQRIMEENSASLDYAKRYYGISLVLRELVVHAQRSYIAKVDTIWMGKLRVIESDLQQAIADDRRELRREASDFRKGIFSNNIEQNQFALNVLNLYRQRLQEQRQKVAEALQDSVRDLAAAFSTYKSVRLTANLINVLENSRLEFQELMKIQIPEIVPFENEAIQDRFREFTEQLKGS